MTAGGLLRSGNDIRQSDLHAAPLHDALAGATLDQIDRSHIIDLTGPAPVLARTWITTGI